MSDVNKLYLWYNEYLFPHSNPLSTSDGYVENVIWEHSKDEDTPKGTFHKGTKDETSSEIICSQLGVTRQQLSKYANAFVQLKKLTAENRFKNQYNLRKSKQFQRYIVILVQLEFKAHEVYKYDEDYGASVPLTNINTYLTHGLT